MENQNPIIVVVEPKRKKARIKVARGETRSPDPDAEEIASTAHSECVAAIRRNASEFAESLASPRHAVLREHARRAALIECGKMLWFKQRILNLVRQGDVAYDVYALADAMRDSAYSFDCQAEATSLAERWPVSSHIPKRHSASDRPEKPAEGSASKRPRRT